MAFAHSFEDFIEASNSASNKEALFTVYKDTVQKHGLDRVLLCLATDHQDIGEKQGTTIMHNYPADWMSHYFEKGFDKIDPVKFFSFSQATSFKWDKIPLQMEITKDQRQCLNLGREAGLHDGICTPLRGPNNSIAGLSLASSQKKDGFDGNIDLINAYSNHFYVAYRRLGEDETKLSGQKAPNFSLTAIEREILCWIAEGKSRWEIGVLTNLSEHTIAYHLRKIFKKMGVNEQIIAVTKAIRYGLIDPYGVHL